MDHVNTQKNFNFEKCNEVYCVFSNFVLPKWMLLHSQEFEMLKNVTDYQQIYIKTNKYKKQMKRINTAD